MENKESAGPVRKKRGRKPKYLKESSENLGPKIRKTITLNDETVEAIELLSGIKKMSFSAYIEDLLEKHVKDKKALVQELKSLYEKI